MSRSPLMTVGILFILIGIQLSLVESFVLTPKATDFWNNRFNRYKHQTVPGDYVATSDGYFRGANPPPRQNIDAARNSYPYSTPSYQRYPNSRVPSYQSAYRQNPNAAAFNGPQKMVTPPSWFTWPPIFLGSVLFLYGAATRE